MFASISTQDTFLNIKEEEEDIKCNIKITQDSKKEVTFFWDHHAITR